MIMVHTCKSQTHKEDASLPFPSFSSLCLSLSLSLSLSGTVCCYFCASRTSAMSMHDFTGDKKIRTGRWAFYHNPNFTTTPIWWGVYIEVCWCFVKRARKRGRCEREGGQGQYCKLSILLSFKPGQYSLCTSILFLSHFPIVHFPPSSQGDCFKTKIISCHPFA